MSTTAELSVSIVGHANRISKIVKRRELMP
jgi:hypothetical protein